MVPRGGSQAGGVGSWRRPALLRRHPARASIALVPRFLATPRLRSAALPFAANGVLYGTWAARIPEIQAQAELSEGALGLALLGSAVGLVVSASVAGALVGRFGAHRVTLAGLALFAAVVVGPGLATSFAGLAFALALVGLTSGLTDVAMNAWATDVEAAEGATVLGACHGMFSLGGMAGAGLGALAAAYDLPLALHFGASGAAFAGGALAQGWAARSTPPDTLSGARGGAAGPVVALPVGPVAGLAALAFCGLIIEGAMADWSAVYLRRGLGASAETAALGFAVFSASMAAARFAADALTARVGSRRLVRVGAFAGAGGLALCVAAPAVGGAVAGFTVVGLGFAAVVPTLFRAAARAPGLGAGRGIAAVTTTGYAGFLAGPPALGFVAEAAGLRVAFALLIVLALAVALGAGPAFRAAAPER
ncbi:MFS transporter [Rubrivirga sp. S365]|uniref:MFS transporter n=1 Tax=Rubrivirga sp. S365 TaxID=3076080 RepID=UPI0028C7F891|nr:MFS transporter [Rubrivirga sp. S365]MDT7857583.1 MFS transporter [Rubrivirga sp. S365]